MHTQDDIEELRAQLAEARALRAPAEAVCASATLLPDFRFYYIACALYVATVDKRALEALRAALAEAKP